MPNIKPENEKKAVLWLGTARGEAITVAAVGGSLWAFGASLIAYIIRYLSRVLYPFSYPFVPNELYTLLPDTVVLPSFAANLIFGMLFSMGIYLFEKNIFYRRINSAAKAAFASIAACLFIFISGFLTHSDILSFLFMSTDPLELPLLFVYYFLMSLPLFTLCKAIRREIFLMP